MIRKISKNEIDKMDFLYRNNLMNAITGYKSANLIATKDHEGLSNLAIFSSVTHFGSNPPVIGFVLRPNTVLRNTYENIKSSGEYTINHVNSDIISDAHHTSAKYPPEVSEFNYTNLSEEYHPCTNAPFVKEAVIKIAMKFHEEIPVKINGTILILGTVQKLILPDSIIAEDGFVDLNTAKTVAITGLDAYHQALQINRLPYARPKDKPFGIQD